MLDAPLTCAPCIHMAKLEARKAKLDIQAELTAAPTRLPARPSTSVTSALEPTCASEHGDLPHRKRIRAGVCGHSIP